MVEPKGLRRSQSHGRCGDVAASLARLLLILGRDEPVRTIEAVAAAIANKVDQILLAQAPVSQSLNDRAQSRHECFAQFLAMLAAPLNAPCDRACEDDAAYASCLRIARRALAAAINDPTGGATRYHPIDEAPRWTRGLLPCAAIGGFLFYRDDESLLTPEIDEGR